VRNIKLIPVTLDCQAVIEYVNKLNQWEVSPYEGPHQMQTESRVLDMPLNKLIFDAVSQAVAEYRKTAPLLQIAYDEGYKVLKYEVGQEFPPHIDQNQLPMMFTRCLSIVLYLNDDFVGGETVFGDIGVTIKPQTGHALVFPSNFAYPHCSTPITQGTKYSLVTWLHHTI